MSKERRRYFRINETLGIAYQILELPGDDKAPAQAAAANPMDRIFEHDGKIQALLRDVSQTDPKIAALAALLNQKLERVVSQLMVENRLMDRIARRVKEANISACGIAFTNDEAVPVGTTLKLELSLFPEEAKLNMRGRVVGCDGMDDGSGFYWRIEFFGMAEQTQEQLIQHIVKRQSAQLKNKRPLDTF